MRCHAEGDGVHLALPFISLSLRSEKAGMTGDLALFAWEETVCNARSRQSDPLKGICHMEYMAISVIGIII